MSREKDSEIRAMDKIWAVFNDLDDREQARMVDWLCDRVSTPETIAGDKHGVGTLRIHRKLQTCAVCHKSIRRSQKKKSLVTAR